MEFTPIKNRTFFSLLVLLIVQVISVLSAPVGLPTSKEVNKSKRSFIGNAVVESSYALFEKPSHWGNNVYAYIYTTDDQENEKAYLNDLNEWPGQLLYKVYGEENVYEFKYYKSLFEDNYARIIFSDGKYQVPAVLQEGFPLVGTGYYTEKGLQSLCVNSLSECSRQALIRYQANDHWIGRQLYAHYKIGNGEWTKVPEPMNRTYNSEYYYGVEVGNENEVTVAFTDGNEWDNNHGQNFKVQALTYKLLMHTI